MILSVAVAFESEWKRYSSSQSDKKMLAFEYGFSLKVYMQSRDWFMFHFLGPCTQAQVWLDVPFSDFLKLAGVV